MGNRAVITNSKRQIGIYLHWNGGPESICAFLTYAKAYGIRTPEGDSQYCFARLTQIIGNFFGGTCSVGIDVYEHLDTDNGDNGVYIVDNEFNVPVRLFCPAGVEKYKESYMREFLKELDKRMGDKGVEDKKILDTIEFVKVRGLEIIKGEQK